MPFAHYQPSATVAPPFGEEGGEISPPFEGGIRARKKYIFHKKIRDYIPVGSQLNNQTRKSPE